MYLQHYRYHCYKSNHLTKSTILYKKQHFSDGFYITSLWIVPPMSLLTKSLLKSIITCFLRCTSIMELYQLLEGKKVSRKHIHRKVFHHNLIFQAQRFALFIIIILKQTIWTGLGKMVVFIILQNLDRLLKTLVQGPSSKYQISILVDG